MRAEVAVVGAGIIGALAAYELRKRGLSVLLLDAGKEGAATQASAGMLAPHPEGLSGEVLEAGLFGLDYYPSLLAELRGLGLEVEAAFPGTWWWPFPQGRWRPGTPANPCPTRCGVPGECVPFPEGISTLGAKGAPAEGACGHGHPFGPGRGGGGKGGEGLGTPDGGALYG